MARPVSEERVDLDAQFDAVVEALREEIRRLRGRVDRFGRAVETAAERQARSDARGSARDETTQRAYRRLKQLQLAAQHIESSAAYLLGSGVEPEAHEHDERMAVAQRVLESLEAERERLYRDVHDGPAQVLANAIFEIEYIERLAERAPDDLRATLATELANVKSQFRASLESVRAMIYDLRPPVLSQLGLAEALRNYAGEFETRSGIAVTCELERDETGLEPSQELAVYRVMQEALQNVHKHAQAASVRITWSRAPEGWSLHCVDDGGGFDLVRAARRARSVGLFSMRERAELIGGSLQVTSAPGQGTTVTLLIPANKENGARG